MGLSGASLVFVAASQQRLLAETVGTSQPSCIFWTYGLAAFSDVIAVKFESTEGPLDRVLCNESLSEPDGSMMALVLMLLLCWLYRGFGDFGMGLQIARLSRIVPLCPKITAPPSC